MTRGNYVVDCPTKIKLGPGICVALLRWQSATLPPHRSKHPLCIFAKKVEKLSPPPPHLWVPAANAIVVLLGKDKQVTVNKITIKPKCETIGNVQPVSTITTEDQLQIAVSYKSRASSHIVFEFPQKGTHNGRTKRHQDPSVMRSIACFW